MGQVTVSAGSVDSCFELAVPAQRATLMQLRKLILSIAPEAVEAIKWGRPCYSHARGMFCYLHSTQGHAKLGFQKGATLQDPGHLLEGTGKEMRHVKFRGGRTPSEAGVRELIRQAASS